MAVAPPCGGSTGKRDGGRNTSGILGFWVISILLGLSLRAAQNNGCDCGLFTCMAADYIANNQLDLAYDQGAMPAFRRRMAARIIAGTLDAEEARQPGAPLRSECL